MKRLASIAAAVSSLIASDAFGGYIFSTQRTPLTGANAGLDRVVLYALGTGTFGDVFAADLTVTSGMANGLKFTIIPDETDPVVAFLSANPQTANRSRGHSTLFHTIAPGFPQPPTGSPTGPATYSEGVTTFKIIGFDGRDGSSVDIGVKADSSQNGGRGAAIFAAVVPSAGSCQAGWPTVSFTGEIIDEQLGSQNIPIAVTDGTVATLNLAPVFISPPPQTINFGGSSAESMPFSVTFTASDPNVCNILSLAIGTIPAGVSGITVSPAAGAQTPATFTVTGLLARSTIGTTVTLPFTISDGQGASTPGALIFNVVVPEPTSVAAIAGAIGWAAARRRRR